jgi:hypothetical protein
MKKLTYCLLTCLACFQSSYALETLENQLITDQLETQLLIDQEVGATSALVESVLEMQAILTAVATSQFPSGPGQNEFVVNLFRQTRKVDITGRINYILETCSIGRRNNCRRVNKYLAVIRVRPNEAIGPDRIKVLSIEPIDDSSHVEAMLNEEEILN